VQAVKRPTRPPSIISVTQPRPRGRQDVANAILDSARTLIADRGPSRVTLREIADHAGVNFGLLYHYFGTKDQLLNEVFARAAGVAADRFVEENHLDDALRVLMTMGDGTTARLVAWAVLEGRDPAELFGQSPALTVLADLLVRDAADQGNPVSADAARVFAAMAMVFALGWRLFGPMALAVAGADGSEPAVYADQVREYMRRFAVAAVSADPPTFPGKQGATSTTRAKASKRRRAG
jgi:AcrR family transcriptional regulator